MSVHHDSGQNARPKLRPVKRSKSPAPVVMRRIQRIGSRPKPRSSEKRRAA